MKPQITEMDTDLRIVILYIHLIREIRGYKCQKK